MAEQIIIDGYNDDSLNTYEKLKREKEINTELNKQLEKVLNETYKLNEELQCKITECEKLKKELDRTKALLEFKAFEASHNCDERINAENKLQIAMKVLKDIAENDPVMANYKAERALDQLKDETNDGINNN